MDDVRSASGPPASTSPARPSPGTAGLGLDLVVALPGGERRPVTVRTGPGATAGDLAEALAAALVPGAPARGPAGDEAPALFAGVAPVAADAPLAGLHLRHGGLVGLGCPVAEPVAADGLQVAVVGGLAGGASVGARSGQRVTVGRLRSAGLVVPDPEVSRRHAVVQVGRDGAGATLADAGSRNGVSWQGFRLEGAVALTPGDVAQVGESVIGIRPAAVADAGLDEGLGDGTVRYNRPPRITPPTAERELVLPEEPEAPSGRRFPLAAVLLPLVLGAGMFVVVGPTPYLLFIALSPLMMLANFVGDRRSGRADYRKSKAEFDAAMEHLDRDLAAAVAADEREARVAHPDPAALLAIATGPTGRLWERRVDDPDFLELRLGLADRLAAVRLRGGGGGRGDQLPQPPAARLAPVTVALADAGVLGVAGPRPTVVALARSILASAVTLHGPRDLRLVVLTGSDEAADWAWTGWLPHLAPADEGGPRRAAGAGRAQVEARLGELAGLVAARRRSAGSELAGGPAPVPRILVVLDGARRMRALAGLAEVLVDGPGVGVYALCLDGDEASLPSECRASAVATSDSPSRLLVRRPGREPVVAVLADGLDGRRAERLARSLAPVRDLGGTRASAGSLPARARLLDVVDLADPTGAEVAARWRAAPAGRSTRVVLGVTGDGAFSVDLVADGPHALVAGTTGSGKSELLQTLVASLALANRPDQLNVVLVDYKGGSAFARCAELPHCVGVVTDLDGHLTERALASLSAELRRRERLLAGVGAKDIEGYWAVADVPLPRLVIVIDEFATLVEEVPDFVKGVVGIGMRGRSLGIHVVLATQRPAGVVTADLRANVNLRLCLRVADPQESIDVLDSPDAVHLSTARPGRAFARTGHRRLTAFQTARIGGPRPSSVPAGADDRPAVEVTPWRFEELGAAVAEAGDDDDGEDRSDLDDLVDAVRAAAAAEDVHAPSSPWLAPLPDVVTLDDLDDLDELDELDELDDDGDVTSGPAAAVLGLADRPSEQARTPFVVDLERTGTVLVVGGARSGRSTVLRSLAASLAAASSPEALHLYVVDAGNRSLAGLAALPHTGAVVPAEDHDRTERLFELLAAEVALRQRALAAGGFASVAEQRAACRAEDGEALAQVVVLVDKLEAFRALYQERDGGRMVDVLERFLREGPSAGVTFVVASDRGGLSARLTSMVEHRLVLRQADRDDYLYVGVPPRSVPEHMPPGRAFWAATLVEVQVALLDPDPAGGAQGAALARRAEAARLRWAGVPADRRARRVEPLPEAIGAEEAEALRRGPRPGGDTVVTIGVGGDELGPVDVDLADAGHGFVVAGPPRSGRSSALMAVVRSLAGRPCVVVAPRPSPLRRLAGEPGVLAVLDAGPDSGDALADLLDDIGGPLAVVVDDAELVSDGPLATELDRRVRTARDRDLVIVAAATTDDVMASRFRGWLAELRRARTGLLLCPASNLDGEVFDVRLPRSLAGGWPPGRALLVARGRTAPVQVLQAAAELR